VQVPSLLSSALKSAAQTRSQLPLTASTYPDRQTQSEQLEEDAGAEECAGHFQHFCVPNTDFYVFIGHASHSAPCNPAQ